MIKFSNGNQTTDTQANDRKVIILARRYEELVIAEERAKELLNLIKSKVKTGLEDLRFEEMKMLLNLYGLANEAEPKTEALPLDLTFELDGLDGDITGGQK